MKISNYKQFLILEMEADKAGEDNIHMQALHQNTANSGSSANEPSAEHTALAKVNQGRETDTQAGRNSLKRIAAWRERLVELCGGHMENMTVENVKTLLNEGMPIDFDNGLLLRMACRWGKNDVVKFIFDKTPDKARIMEYGMPLCWAAEHGRKDTINFLIGLGCTKNFYRPMGWLQHSRNLTSAEKIDILDYLQDFVDSGKCLLMSGDESKDNAPRYTEGPNPKEVPSVAAQIKTVQGEEKNYAEAVKKRIRPDRVRP